MAESHREHVKAGKAGHKAEPKKAMAKGGHRALEEAAERKHGGKKEGVVHHHHHHHHGAKAR